MPEKLSNEERIARRRANNRRYSASDKGKATRKARRESPEGKAIRKAWLESEAGKASIAKHEASPKRKAWLKEWKASPKGKASNAAAQKRFFQTEKGKAARHRADISDKGKARNVRASSKRRTLERANGWFIPSGVDIAASLVSRDGPECFYCGASTETEIDHVVPVTRGGPGAWWNLVLACMPCNRSKHDLLLYHWLKLRIANRKPVTVRAWRLALGELELSDP